VGVLNVGQEKKKKKKKKKKLETIFVNGDNWLLNGKIVM